MKKTAVILLIFISISSGRCGSFEELLRRYIDTALQNNPELKAAGQSLESAKKDVYLAQGNMLPRAEFNSRYTRAGGGRDFIVDLTFLAPLIGDTLLFTEHFLRPREHETLFTVKQPLFTGGQLYYNFQASRKMRDSEVHHYNTEIRNLQLAAAEAYINYLSAIERLKTVEKSLELSEEILRVSRVRVMSNSGTIADTLRAQAQLSETKALLISARNSVDIARRNMMRICGSDNIIEIPDNPPVPVIEIPSESELLQAEESVMNRRNEMREMNSILAASKDGIKAIRGGFLPSLAVAADYGWQGSKYILNDDYDLWMVSGVLNWNIFNGFTREIEYQKAQIRRRELQYRREELSEGLKLQVRNCAAELLNTKAYYETAIEIRKAAEENYRIRKTLFQTGGGSMVELLDAAELLAKSESGEAVSAYQLILAQIKYRWAAGEELIDVSH